MAEHDLPRIYTELADWFHLLTAPEEYAEEAAFYLAAIVQASDAPPRTLLELGVGRAPSRHCACPPQTQTVEGRSPTARPAFSRSETGPPGSAAFRPRFQAAG